jgi:threonine/homoserine/homoserine lactone efflux protein
MVIPDIHSLALFMAAALALNLTPGPDMLYVAARSASEGSESGIASAFGIAAGLLVHITLIALGLAALLAAVPIANTILRLGGAAYLIYLGVRALLRPGALAAVRALKPADRFSAFRQGLITNVLNPKVALFFLAFLPQFVDPERGNAAAQVVVLGLLFNTSGTLVNVAVALLVSRAALRISRDERIGRIIQRVTGSLLIGLGLHLAVARQK